MQASPPPGTGAALLAFLRARAVHIQVAAHLESRLRAGDRLRVKLGLDPTAPDIHVGHLVVLDALRAFQDAGHTAVLIVGDFTALVGDPSGRSETRPVLTPGDVDAHARTYLEQVYRVLDEQRTEVRRNSEWLSELGAADVLRLLGEATVQQVLQREDFSERMRSGVPIGLHELLYPLLQGYDSVAVRADVEIGGTDQLFNLLFAREVQRAYGGEPEDVLTFPLLEGTDGSVKMSKSAGNYIGITEAPEEIYGKVMSVPDSLTERYLRLVSGLPGDEVERVLAMHPRDAKAALARHLVRRLGGEAAAEHAERDFELRFKRRTVPEDMPEAHVRDPNVWRALVDLGYGSGEAKRLLDQGGVRVNGEKVNVLHALADGDVLQVGKRKFVRVRLTPAG